MSSALSQQADVGQGQGWILSPHEAFQPAPARLGSDSRQQCVHSNFGSDPGIFLTLSISLIDNGLISDLFFI